MQQNNVQQVDASLLTSNSVERDYDHAAWYERANFKGRNWVWSSHLKVSNFQNDLSFLPKYERNILRISALCSEGRNSDNFLFVFWEKRWLHVFILKLTDLHSHVVFPQQIFAHDHFQSCLCRRAPLLTQRLNIFRVLFLNIWKTLKCQK